MGQGLGKNSPITLSLGKESYEAMIERHGQYVRWRIAKKCPCATSTGQPDIHCNMCGGAGDIYSYQTSFVSTIRLPVVDGIIELDNDEKDCNIKKIYNYAGFSYPFVKEGAYIKINDAGAPLTQGESVDIVFTSSLIQLVEVAKASRICKGFYVFEDLKTDTSNIEGIYYKVPYDVVKIEKLINSDGIEIKIKSLYKNCIEIEESDNNEEELIAYNLSFIKPLKFVILSQNFNKESLYLVQKHNGEAMASFPYMYDVAENDIITVLTGHMTNKIVINKQEGDDILPEYFIDSVLSLETKEMSYKEGEDFILVGTNRIHWINDNKPVKNENMSIVFKYNPTYRVHQSLANLRTSENQRLPKKVILKQLSTFQDARGVSYNG